MPTQSEEVTDGQPRDTLLLDILQRVAALQVNVEHLIEERDRSAGMLVTVAQLTQTVDRLTPIVDKLDGQAKQAAGVMWFGKIIWALIGGGVFTLIGWLGHKFGIN